MDLPTRVALATDHAGFSLKEVIKEFLASKGIDIVDVGTFSEKPVDYPEIIRKGCSVVLEQKCPGIVFGGSGNGEAIAANKVPGIRCALVYNTETAELARQHNDANVMSLGARLTGPEDAKRFVEIFLKTDFDKGRHKKRVKDIELPNTK